MSLTRHAFKAHAVHTTKFMWSDVSLTALRSVFFSLFTLRLLVCDHIIWTRASTTRKRALWFSVVVSVMLVPTVWKLSRNRWNTLLWFEMIPGEVIISTCVSVVGFLLRRFTTAYITGSHNTELISTHLLYVTTDSSGSFTQYIYYIRSW